MAFVPDLASHLRASLTSDALGEAIGTRAGRVRGMVFHTDRGRPHTSKAIAELCRCHGITYLELDPELALLRETDGALVILSHEYNKVSIRPGDPGFLNWLNIWYDYRAAQGDVEDRCETWWESFMADRE